jgi:ligand-binding sensor domain-containing protein/signal transduction histidine kinase
LALLLTTSLDLLAEQLPITIFTTADGLAHNAVHRIVKDSRGFLWFCTAEGLSRFDGYAFTNFGTEQGLPHSSVNDLLETRAGEYWVATDGGLVRFNPKGRPDRHVVYENASPAPAPMFTVVVPEEEDRLARAVTVLLEGRDGTIWAGTNKGLYRLDRENGRSLRPVDIHLPNEFPEQRIIADVLEDRYGSLWIASPSGLYRRWPDGSAARYTTQDGLPNQFLQDLLEDHDGQLWAATRLGGFFRFRADRSRQPPVVDRRFTTPDLPNPWVFQLLETSDHRFWVATARGLLEFLPTGDDHDRPFRAYSTRNGLSYFDITALSEDASGNLWLGTNTAGAMKFALNGFTSYGERDGLLHVGALFNDRAGNLCFRGSILGDARTSVFEGGRLDLVSHGQPGYYHRIGCFDGRHFSGFQPAAMASLDWGWVSERLTLQTRSGEWWVGTGVGLYRFPPADHLDALRTSRALARYTTKDGLATPQVFRLFEDSRGDVWISTIGPDTNGLSRWDHRSARLIDMAGRPGLPPVKSTLPRAFGEDAAGNVWVGFDGQLARYRADGTFELFTSRNGLPPGNIREIFQDHAGRLWLASAQGGLIRVDEPGARVPRFDTYTVTQGLSSNAMEVITEDRSGGIYVGGGRGLDRLDPSTGRVKHFSAADGLPPGLFRAAFRDSSGVLWFGMTSGLARLSPTAATAASPPPVFISSVRINGIPQPVSALGEREMSLPALAPRQDQLQIDFVGPGFGREVLRYQFKLEGADAGWSAPDEQRTVTYASLAAGRYTFIVRAVNPDGIVSNHPASFAFTILRPLWLQWWSLTLAALAVGLTIHAVYRYRVARLLEMANMRTRIATDLHDDIGANLTRIALLSEVARQKEEKEQGVTASRQGSLEGTGTDDGPLVSIARIARESVSSMSDIVWAINPARDSLLDLTRRMRQQADEVFTLRGVALRFSAPGAHDELRLGVDVRRDLLLIFKEAVNNSARHSECSRVEIDLRVEGSHLVLTMLDNGGGFDPSLESEGQGLMSMRRRAQRLKGTLDIASRAGIGTTVVLTIPT